MLRIGNWNKQGLDAPGKIDVLLKECDRNNINIIAVTELHWQGKDRYQLDNWNLVYSNQRENTIGLLVTSKTPPKADSNEYVSDRLVISLFKCLSASITLIGCYVPHNREDRPNNIQNKYSFYNDLYGITAHAPKHNVLIVIGYLNDDGNLKWRPTIAKRELGDINENGISLLPYGLANKLNSSRSSLKQIKKTLKHFECDAQLPVVNHTLIKEKWKTSLSDLSKCECATLGSDRDLVVGTVKFPHKSVS